MPNSDHEREELLTLYRSMRIRELRALREAFRLDVGRAQAMINLCARLLRATPSGRDAQANARAAAHAQQTVDFGAARMQLIDGVLQERRRERKA